MKDRVRLGIIGVGTIGKSGHLEHYTRDNEPVDIVAACDINEAELNRVSDKYNIPNRYTDFRKLLERDDLDGVDICLHNNYHAPVTIEALKSGKNVYCEKPIAGTWADGKTMVDAAKAYGKMLHIQLSTIYSPETRAAQHLLAEGALGDIYHMRSVGFRRRGRPFVDGYATKEFVNSHYSAGGALFDMGVYHIAQLLYIMNVPEPELISGKVYQKTGMYEHRRQESGYNVEEMGVGFVKFKGDLTMDFIETWACHMGGLGNSMLFGDKGGVSFDPFMYYSDKGDLAFNGSFDLKAWEYMRHQCFEDYDITDSSTHHWIAALQGRCQLLNTAEIALQTMLIQNGIYLSSQLGREVSADEVKELSKPTSLEI